LLSYLVLGDCVFEKPIADWPKTTAVIIDDGISVFNVEIPTTDVFIKGDWLSRRFAGISFSMIEDWLLKNGHHPVSIKIAGM